MPTITLNIFNLLILFGALQGILLGLILIFTKRLRKTSNMYLALMMFVFATLNLENTMNALDLFDRYPILRTIPIEFMTLIPVSLYFFIKYLLNPSYKIQKWDYYLVGLFGIEFLHKSIRFIRYFISGPYDNEQSKLFYLIENTIELVAVFVTIYLIFYASKELKQYEQNLYDNYAEIEGRNLSWLRKTFIFGLALCGVWFVVTLSDFTEDHFSVFLAYTVWIGLSIMMYWIGFSMIIQQGLLDSTIFAISESKQKEPLHSSNELSSKTDEHYQRIIELMEVEKLYHNPNLNMSILSEKSELSNGYVSQIINQKRKQNFFDFINSYRVEEVKIRMADLDYDHYTVLALAQDAGFKSKSTFNSVFKKMTGQTPSQFRKNQKSE